MEIILELINEKKYSEAREELLKLNSVDIATLLEEVDNKKNMLVLFRLLPKDIEIDVFSYMSNDMQQYIIQSITHEEMTTIIDQLYFDDVIDLLEEMPANIVKKILLNTDEKKRKLINQFLKYEEDSAGSIMTIEFVDLKKEMTVEQAIERIRKIGVDKQTINTCYVIDGNRKLEGIISIRRLILSNKDVLIKDIMKENYVSINTFDDQEYVANQFKKYDLVSMPVVDKEHRLVGIITIDDIVDIIDQENTEDFHKMAAMEPSEEEYLKTGVFELAKHRIIWLLVLMISATFTGNIIRKSEDVLQSVVILASFIPMLMDTGGNSGSQSSTLVIRGLALGEIKLKDIFKVMWKEFRVSVVVGIALSVVNFLRVYFIEKVSFMVSMTVCISLFFTVVLAKVVGGILPIVAKKLKLDPAIMASPLITTIVDAVALLIYFGIAKILLGI
ncbi:magnesium transporter [Clostridium botulinum]|uniref:Magnesium transporter MgtE n=1 Tax=Clostridium botulinum (strain Langeland / NCTC 10281 / Type F) TaxID=441772 RepID=A7GCG7_CLOBL|nr:magnesium transporter [Clostridium botulinum]ABS42479.1 magnesium transporter [Clostridium botulinum F str. Langeland]ADF98937.1 magnesium transporter [Clostridium botulinum F str. 230613]KKM39784.1 magnesium transporter [Clostridium botulinum]MBY6792202.1 magnesium transporter [Clostridium botulinum]MBY6936211.1 magnesium transporter [Clostridium botulinum]